MHWFFGEVEMSEKEQQTAPMDFDSIQIHKATIDRLLETDNFVDAMAVYMFYIYTARWQKTARIRAVTAYVSNGIGLSEPRVRRAKKTLIGLDLIRDQQSIKDNKITGHYVEIRFSFYSDSQEVSHPNDFPQCGKSHSVENHQTNALSNSSLNALSNSRGNAKKPTSFHFEGELPKTLHKEMFDEWIEYRNEQFLVDPKKFTLWTQRGAKTAVNKLAKLSHADQRSVIEYSIMGSYANLFFDRLKQGNQKNNNTNYNKNGQFVENSNKPTHASHQIFKSSRTQSPKKPRHITDMLNGS